MESISVINWIIRICLALAVTAAAVVAIRAVTKGRSQRLRELRDLLSRSMKKRVNFFLAVTGLVGAAHILLPLSEFGPDVAGVASAVMNVAWVVLAAWGVTLLLSVFTGVVQWKYDVEVEDNLDARGVQTRVRILHRLLVVLIWFAAAAAVLLQFEGFRMLGGTMLASAGVLSIVIGISAQKTLGSIIAGIQIAMAHPINLDDVVIVEGEWGRIEEITFTYVVVKIWDQRRLVVPITYFTDKPFQNWTKTSAEILGTVFLHVDYTTPLEPLREELKRLCESAGSLWNGKTCGLQVTDAGTESMTVRALVSSSNASKAWDLRCLVREGLIDFLKTHYPDCLPRRRVELKGGSNPQRDDLPGTEEM